MPTTDTSKNDERNLREADRDQLAANLAFLVVHVHRHKQSGMEVQETVPETKAS